ncbi:OmpA family protein [Candidatus Sumerlaeota bacterium]|nr:OmpA family protein [Candidatus Sumerlaeota bacterium]
MKPIRIVLPALTLILTISLMTGCTRVQKGAALGGGAGAAVGALWANNYGLLSAAEGGMVGFATGGLVGALAADSMDSMGGPSSGELDNLQRDLDARQAMLDRQKGANDDLQKEIDALNTRIKDLEKALGDARGTQPVSAEKPGDENITVKETVKGVEYTILGSVLFDSGMAELKPEGKATLDKLGQLLQEKYAGHELNIEGHTDDEPIQFSGYVSNWELGAARGLVVLHYLQDNYGFSGGSLSSTTFSHYRPAGKERKENRRAVIVVMPKKK